MKRPPVYLDYNATSPLCPEAAEAMIEALQHPMNPSSVHGFGRRAKQIVEQTRRVLAERIACFPTEIVFTGSGTEANNSVLKAFADRRILTSAIEHASVLRAAPADRLPVRESGVLDLEALERGMAENPAALVSIMLANNETGVIQPVAEAAAIVHRHGGLLHCDAVQGLGKIPIDLGLLGADFMTLAAHKAGGPVGAAALIVRQGKSVPALLIGGGQERGQRAGTENIGALASWSAALAAPDDWAERNRRWHEKLEATLAAEAPAMRVMGRDAPRLPNTSTLLMPGVKAETQLMHFDLEGFAVSAGSACSSGRIEPSHVLQAMGMGPDAECVIRVSSGWATKKEEMGLLADAWLTLYRRLTVIKD